MFTVAVPAPPETLAVFSVPAVPPWPRFRVPTEPALLARTNWPVPLPTLTTPELVTFNVPVPEFPT